MRIPFSVMDGVETIVPSKSGNAMNAGIDFYVPKSGTFLEFNPGIKDQGVFEYPMNVPMKRLHGLINTVDRGQFVYAYEKLDISNPIRKLYSVGIMMEHLPRIEDGKFLLYPGENVLIHSGIAVEIDLGQYGMVCNRSGIGSKESCVVGAHLVDTGYANEIMFDIHNIGLRPIPIEPGMKITQLLIGQYISCTPFQIPYEELYSQFKELKFRGLAGFGSTGNK